MLINLGTPDNLDISSVKKYLNEFLMDPYVVGLPLILRAILVKGIIVPTRSSRSLEAYEKVWTQHGSPLRIHSQVLVDKVADNFPELEVRLAMRYGKDNIGKSYKELIELGCNNIISLPLFPQYARETTGSIIAELEKLYRSIQPEHKMTIMPPFYNDELFIASWSEIIKKTFDTNSIDHLVFSYHSLPVKQLETGGYGCRKSDCFKDMPCPNFQKSSCYRLQCYQTSEAIAKSLGLN